MAESSALLPVKALLQEDSLECIRDQERERERERESGRGGPLRLLLACAAIALMCASATAQGPPPPGNPPPSPPVPPNVQGAPYDPTILTQYPALPDIAGSAPDPTFTVTVDGYTVAGDQICVQFVPGTSQTTIQSIETANSLTQLCYNGPIDWYLFELPSGANVQTVQSTLAGNSNVQFCEYNSVGTLQTAPVDSYYSALWNNNPGQYYQWNLYTIGMGPTGSPNVWDAIVNAYSALTNIYVGILDSGVLWQQYNGVWQTHADLAGRFAASQSGPYGYLWYNTFNTSAAPVDGVGHGTGVTAVLGAKTAFSGTLTGMAGVNPYSWLVPIQVTNAAGTGNDMNLAVGIGWAVKQPGMRVLNASIGNFKPSNQVLQAIDMANQRNIAFIAAQGNRQDFSGSYSWPGAYWLAMSVNATTWEDAFASAYALPQLYTSVAAPGGDGSSASSYQLIWSPDIPLGAYGAWWGTSFATPQVSGIASVLCALFPSMNWRDLQYRIEDTATDINYSQYPGWDEYIGWGRLNASAATTAQTSHLPSVSYSSGESMASYPGWPDGLSASGQSGDPAAVFGTGAQCIWWDPVGQTYRPYSTILAPRIGPGRGYWVNLSSNHTASLAGAYPFQTPNHPVRVHLYKGWNLIGTPAANNVAWNWTNILVLNYDPSTTDGTFGQNVVKTLYNAAAAGWIYDYAYQYDPNSPSYYDYITDTRATNPSSSYHTLVPGQGYWIQALQECELLLPSQ